MMNNDIFYKLIRANHHIRIAKQLLKEINMKLFTKNFRYNKQTYNPKEVYILNQASRQIANGNLIVHKPDFFTRKVYVNIDIDGNKYEVSIKKILK